MARNYNVQEIRASQNCLKETRHQGQGNLTCIVTGPLGFVSGTLERF